MKRERCPGCGVELPASDGPVHRYMESSPSCWAAYGRVLAREYSRPAFMAAHRLTVDAYAIQHPGHPSPQTIQSIAVHLIALYLVLEQQRSHADATVLLRRCVDTMTFTWLEPPPYRGALNVTSVLQGSSPAEHVRAVHRWASSAWQAWSAFHPQVSAWAAQAQSRPSRPAAALPPRRAPRPSG